MKLKSSIKQAIACIVPYRLVGYRSRTTLLSFMQYFSFNTIEAENTFLRFAGGDEAALGFIYTKLYGPLVRYGCRRLDDDFEVATIVQEAFTRLWELRARITSLLHAYRFLRLVVRWGCAGYYRQPASYFRRYCIHRIDWVENLPAPDDEHHHRLHHRQEELSQAVYKVIPYLPPTRQTVMALYFRHGFTCKQIAGRFHTSNSAISLELQKSLDFLRQAIHHTKKKAAPLAKSPLPAGPAFDCLSPLQQQVYSLRTAGKKSFEQIAALLGQQQAGVQQHYVKACLALRQQEQQAKVPYAIKLKQPVL